MHRGEGSGDPLRGNKAKRRRETHQSAVQVLDQLGFRPALNFGQLVVTLEVFTERIDLFQEFIMQCCDIPGRSQFLSFRTQSFITARWN